MYHQMNSSSDMQNSTFYLSRISHEIRNPLTLIYSTAQLLAMKHPDLGKDELWDQLISDINYLNELTDSISAYNHCQQLSVCPTDLNLLLQKLTDSYMPVIQHSHKKLTLTIKNPLPELICDPLKIRECLINLIKNSMEATSEHDIISVTAFANPRYIHLIIGDTGKGIDSQQLKHIFEPFATYKKGGTGLGLAITQQIIKAHHGTIRVFSKYNKGTVFIIRLPLSEPKK
ncbi:MAG TPA: HAMP domain-containing histidine kinase [Candidatus Scybalocola faecipullorum]|nr:HAMP domain-containing histidine kinase [Candidatus Scybalocola faecipullorum]